MKKSDIYRKAIINQILTEGQSSNNRVSFSYDKEKNSGFYSEIITLEEIQQSTENFSTESSVESFLENFIHNRIGVILEDCGYSIDVDAIDQGSSNFYDGYELNIPILRESEELLEDLFSEIDAELNPAEKEPTPAPNPAPAPEKVINKQVKNRVSDVPITKEPTPGQTPHLPTQAKVRKTNLLIINYQQMLVIGNRLKL